MSQNSVLSFHHTQSDNTSSPAGGLKTDVYDEMSSIVPVLSPVPHQYNGTHKVSQTENISSQKRFFCEHRTQSAK